MHIQINHKRQDVIKVFNAESLNVHVYFKPEILYIYMYYSKQK